MEEREFNRGGPGGARWRAVAEVCRRGGELSKAGEVDFRGDPSGLRVYGDDSHVQCAHSPGYGSAIRRTCAGCAQWAVVALALFRLVGTDVSRGRASDFV